LVILNTGKSNTGVILAEIEQNGDWLSVFKHNPIEKLLSEKDEALEHRVRCDLLGEKKDKPSPLEDDSVYKDLVRRQKPDGSWRESGRFKNDQMWTFITTVRNLYRLLDRNSDFSDESFERGVKYLITTQTDDGDFRGGYGPDIQGPDYTGMVCELLYRGNYPEKGLIDKAMSWLIDIRRNDCGWAIPDLRSNSKKDPSSHCVTGMALRAFAAAPDDAYANEAKQAGQLLARRIFTPDKYPDRRGVEYWGKLSYPFWFTDALSALDVLSLLGFDLSEGRMERAFNWLIKQQGENGYWSSDFRRTEKEPDSWLTYAMLKTTKRLLE